MLEEEWIQIFGLHEGKMLYQIIQKHKKESEETDVSKHYYYSRFKILKVTVRYYLALLSNGLDDYSYYGPPHYRIRYL